jgi:hypothetical protein
LDRTGHDREVGSAGGGETAGVGRNGSENRHVEPVFGSLAGASEITKMEKTNFRGGDPHQVAGNEHLRFLVVAGPKAHTSRMRNLTITALLLLSCCARFDEVKETERCQKAHPNDQAAADECFETSVLEWEKANAWVARITHRRPETP